jgi:AbrB family looped-hinge helix DNA binding protein
MYFIALLSIYLTFDVNYDIITYIITSLHSNLFTIESKERCLMDNFKLSTISKKGQTTVPIEIRQKLNLREGDHVIFEIKPSGEILLKKAISIENMDYLRSVEKTLTEWMGTDDDDL